MIKKTRPGWIVLGILVLSLLMHLPIFKIDLIGFHVWRQTETQTVTQCFYEEPADIFHPHKYDLAETDGLHVREFPLMQYVFSKLAAWSDRPFTVSRWLSFLISCFSITGIYLLGRCFGQNPFLTLAVPWMLAFSPVFYYYAVNPMPDNLALCFSIFSLYHTIKWKQQNRFGSFLYAALFLALATLIKLPFILTGGALAWFMLARLRQKEKLQDKIMPWITAALFLLIPLCWYIYSIPYWHGVGVKQGIFDGISFSDSVDIIVHHLVSALPELFVNYAAMPAFVAGIFFFIRRRKKPISDLGKALFFQLVLLVLFFLFEHNMIGKVHDYYLLPFLPIIVLCSFYGLRHVLLLRTAWIRYAVITGIVIMPVTAYLRIQTRWNEASPGFAPALYTHRETIRQLLPSNAKCITGEDESGFIHLYYLHCKGWTYNAQKINEAHFNQWRSLGATHFVTSNENDTLRWIKPLLGEKIFDRDGTRIYQIR